MQMRSEAAWSYLDPKPICLYDPKYDAHLVYWNGIATTKSIALMIYAQVWTKMYPTESQRQAAFEDFNRIYKAGGFGTRAWDQQINARGYYSFYDYISKLIAAKDSKFFNKLREQYSPQEALAWFMPSKELTSR
jgi:hypothetical protein